MDQISELEWSLNGELCWNKARMGCFIQMLLALFLTRSVNLNKLACMMVGSHADQSSKYRRLQRFFAYFKIDFDVIARFLFRLFFTMQDSCYLTLDRTNWKWGKENINVLMLGIAYKGTAIPIYWELLNKRGNSDTPERIDIMKKFIKCFGKACIAGVLADREFIGQDWFDWLSSQKIPFCIRIRNNTVAIDEHNKKRWISSLFHGLHAGEKRVLAGRYKVTESWVCLSGLKLEDGSLLIVASDKQPEKAIETYALRWEIETLFGCLKGRGFNFEDTHITHRDRIKKLLVLLSIAFAWAHKTGEWRSKIRPLKLKKHGRPAVSLFRLGLDFIAAAWIAALNRKNKAISQCRSLLEIHWHPDKRVFI